jgi:hypothetical protein
MPTVTEQELMGDKQMAVKPKIVDVIERHRCDLTGQSLCIYGQRWLGRGPYEASTYDGPCSCACHQAEQADAHRH